MIMKHTTISQRTFFKFSRYFTFLFLSSFSFLLSLFKLLCTMKHHVYNLYRISFTLSFCYVIYYIVSEIYIRGRFLEDYFYCYPQQIVSAVGKECLIPCNLIQRGPETWKL